ncbi:hypothetical protein LSH36_527g01015 [Paralvinella palmiformis]|uniref:E3 SUMO-protein ligase NSE2 n=1 Tax=Paralvinella palmiformis TaxID=53620 RepID=A0AAD9J7M8_9ANNE|nr:hypothetical protein LSH36_527g01015 [Paralvinella palmiformis]
MPKGASEDSHFVQNISTLKNEPRYVATSGNQALTKKQGNKQNKMNATPRTPTRRTIGGRGREWAAECLKLLEALLELDDSKPVKEPVNPLKFPEYYSQVANPIDLSKVMLKFHGGVYHSLDAFSRDMRQMFNSYKMFFKEANTEIYTQVNRLSWWFEAEITRIQEKFGKTIYYKGQAFISVRESNERRGRPPKQTPLYYEETQEQVVQDEPRSEKKLRVRGRSSSYYRDNEDASPTNLTTNPAPSASHAENNTNIIVSINHGPCAIATTQEKNTVKNLSELDNGDSTRPRYIHDLADPNLQRAISHLKPSTVSQLIGRRRLSSTKAESSKSNAQRQSLLSNSSPEPSQTNSISTSRPSRLCLDTLMLEVTVSNIWFGTARIKPKKQALLSEEGLQISWTLGDTEIPFTIHAEEIVRCVAHFGRSSHKHTLFVFVLPSCSKRLETLNDKYTHCSMIVVFLNIDDVSNISTLVHIFWKIGHKSMFGPIFSEIDQKGALLLLGNIKPGIMHRVASKYKGIFSPTEKNNFPDVPGLFNSDIITKDAMDANSRKRRHSPKPATQNSGPTSKNSTPSASESAGRDVRGEELDIAESTADQLASVSQLLTGAAFDKEFAEKLSASLQQGFKEGVTEVLKNLAVNLCNKNIVNINTNDKYETGEQATDDNNGDESDLEIIIPTDSDDDVPLHSKPKNEDPSLGEGDLAVTGEKISIRCPITQQIMKHPLQNIHCGHCYDRQGVEGIIRNRKEKARCPVAGCSNDIPLNMDDMTYDYSLLSYIQDKVNHDSMNNSPKLAKMDSNKN